jgi:4-aminobutyrate aminotransferase-like enzyme
MRRHADRPGGGIGRSPSAIHRAGRRGHNVSGAKHCTSALVATYEPYVRLAELLNELTPGDFPKKTILANSGAEGVENAVKLSRKFTGRPVVVCFEGGYHGRTLLTLSLTSKYGLFKSGFGPFAPEIVRLPIPHLYRTPEGMTEDDTSTSASASSNMPSSPRSILSGRRRDHRNRAG